ncbi:MAG: multi-sensor hybrid histidine kinase [Bryobacterales bacterium]|nr:multi-sensor hybrid histidine kinase [Bryobacterales bacterium]
MSARSITKLLLIEDNPGDARLFREMFREQGPHNTEITHVTTMAGAERYLSLHTVDIILLDLGLPDADGLDAVRRAHTAAPRVPLVVLTVLDDESLAVRALQEGAQDYLIKGQIESGLLRALRYAIERKIMEDVLFKERSRSEEGWARLAAIHEATPDLVSISDVAGRLLYINRGGRSMIGMDEGVDVTGYRIADFLRNPETHIIATEGIPKAVLDGIWRGETELLRRDGVVVSISMIILAHKRSDGSVEFVSTMARDITAHRLLEAHLRQAQKMEAVGQLAAGVAHEFNNLLQALMSMATILRMPTGAVSSAKIGADMEAQIKRGANLTQQLLLFSRDVAIAKVDLDLQEQVQKASALLRQLIPENIRVVLEIPAQRLFVQGDAGQMQQLLLNLAINARDAMPDGGTLTLRAGACGVEVYLEVEDTGSGITEETRAHMFEPFFSTKDLGKGTGLGLAVVHGIVVEHAGRIEVDSIPGKGSCFRVVLPASLGEGTPAPDLIEEAAEPAGRGYVLLVEDDGCVREGITVLLEAIGYSVIALSSGEEALAIPQEQRPDLLLTDVTLAGIGGATLGELLCKRWPSMRVVLMSGYFEEASRTNAGDRGWHFLQKPFDMSQLTVHLREALQEGSAIFIPPALLKEEMTEKARC